MELLPTALPDVKVLKPRRYGDHRGWFCETFRLAWFEPLGLPREWVQDNHSLSGPIGTLRGLHYQVAPKAQAKLLRVLRGAVLDVAVDIRRSSPTFGKHAIQELSAENGLQLCIPAGFAHGFVTLAPDTEVLYKVTEYYSPEHERGILWNDPDLGIPWGIAAEAANLSGRDTKHPRLKDLPSGDLFA